MTCKICGRSNCTESFHSVDEQEAHDDNKTKFVDPVLDSINSRIERLFGNEIDNECYVKLDEVLEIINDYY